MLFLLPLIALMFGLFLVLWLADIFLTVKCVEHIGNEIEVNPIMGFILRFRRRFLVIFKALEILAFGALLWLQVQQNSESVFFVLLGAILFYSILVSQGLGIYAKVSGKSAPIATIALAISIFAILALYATYTTFVNSVQISDALGRCYGQNSNLTLSCKANSTQAQEYGGGNTSATDKYGLNLTIPG